MPIVAADDNAAAWERAAGIEELEQLARTADRLDFHHLAAGEHIAVPPNLRRWDGKVRGTTNWDPLATFAYMAACTRRVRFATLVLVIGYHHPLALAKQYGTLDLLSGGRLILGCGIGTLEEEFRLLDVPFEDRGARADDALRALRVAMSTPEPSHGGPYFSFSGAVVSPNGSGRPTPIWVGGHTKRSLRRALAFGDGWAPSGLSTEAVSALLHGVERPAGFDIVLSSRALDPLRQPGVARRALDELGRAGATVVNVRVAHTSLTEYLEQLEALHDVVVETGE